MSTFYIYMFCCFLQLPQAFKLSTFTSFAGSFLLFTVSKFLVCQIRRVFCNGKAIIILYFEGEVCWKCTCEV